MPETEDNNLKAALEQRLDRLITHIGKASSGAESFLLGEQMVESAIAHTERLTLALDVGKMGWWDLEVATDKVIWNTYHEIIFGYEPGTPERDYFDWERRIHPDDLERIHQATHFARDHRSDLEIQYRIVWPDGSLHWVNALGRFYYGSEGQPIRMLGVLTDITELKQNEKALRRSEEFNRKVLESSHDCIKILDFEGRLLYMNNPGQRLMELDDFENHKNADWVSFWAPESRLEVSRALEIARQGGVAKFEGRCPTFKGTFKWWEVVATPISNADGVCEQVLIISRDVTDRWQTEQDLRESEERFRITFEQAAMGVAHVDLDGHWLRVNQVLCSIVGYTREELTSKTFLDITHPEDLEADLNYVRQLLAGDINHYSLEKRYLHKDGHLVWVNLTVSLLRETNGMADSSAPSNALYPVSGTGKPKYFISIVEDINDRKRTERELHESEERLSLGVGVGGIAIARFDYASNSVSLSPEAAVLYGFSPDNSVVSREQIQAAFHPDERAELLEMIEQALNPKGTGWFAKDHRVVWPNGEVRWLSVRQQVFFERSGEVPRPSYAILAAIDITNRKQSEVELEERNLELDRFVHIVSHDLKAPLRGIANLAAWIEDDLSGQLPEENQQQLMLMRSRVDRMDAMINGLLEYSKAGRAKLSPEAIDFPALVAEVLELIEVPAEFKVEINAQVTHLRVRRILLNQVLLNLVSNAIKHRDRPDGNLQIGVRDLGKCYEFWVQDDGPGIPPEHHTRIFEIFQTLTPSSALNSSSENTGIGLSIVKKIVEAEGGTLQLASEVGAGSKFSFTWLKEVSSDT
jgi:PAS domain S-box-containing protein